MSMNECEVVAPYQMMRRSRRQISDNRWRAIHGALLPPWGGQGPGPSRHRGGADEGGGGEGPRGAKGETLPTLSEQTGTLQALRKPPLDPLWTPSGPPLPSDKSHARSP
eukprot:934161-Prorocentrum_minimum.AAC.1